MKFLILFPLLAAAASLGMADGSYKTTPSELPTTPPELSNPLPSGSPSAPSPSPSKIPQSKGLPPKPKATSSPSNPSNDTSSSLDPFIDSLSKTAKNPITELLSLSPTCQGALFSIVAQPGFLECVPVGAFLPLLPILIDPNGLKDLLAHPEKIPPLLDQVFGGLCKAPKCTDKLITAALQAINKGCDKKDLKDPLMKMILGVTTFYSPIRDSICFKGKKDFCIVETLETVFTLPKPPFKITGTFVDNVALAEPKFICTSCNKAILNTFIDFIDADTNKCVEFLTAAGVSQGLLTIGKLGAALKCGYQFVDGKVGDPGKSDSDDSDNQLSSIVSAGASNVKGIGFMTMIGTLLVSALMI